MKSQDLHTKIEQTLQSIDHIERAAANPFLLTRVLEKMKKPVRIILRPKLIWQVAASLLLVLGLNIGIGWYSSNKKTNKVQSSENGYFTNHIYNY